MKSFNTQNNALIFIFRIYRLSTSQNIAEAFVVLGNYFYLTTIICRCVVIIFNYFDFILNYVVSLHMIQSCFSIISTYYYNSYTVNILAHL